LSGRGLIPEAWLFDAPLFIDEQQIKSLYNAVALPQFQTESLTISTKDVAVSKWTAGGQIEVSAAESLLAKVFLPVSAKASAKGERGGEQTQGKDEVWNLLPVATPERQLLNLAIHYGAHLKGHLWTVYGLRELSWLDELVSGGLSPRPLVFLELEADTPIVPMAAELTDGKVVLFYNRISAAVTSPGQTLPLDYPKEAGAAMNEYWSWFQDDRARGEDTSRLLMRVVEDEIGAAGRPRWIDYRVPLGAPGAQTRSLHLHLKGRQAYDTGDFAYQLLRRGRKHGLRVVGTLKSGPDMNVLAVYEK
jgi:hypothetical protein